jgi:nicotinate-nucleotide adenylyltransferase
MVVQAFNTMEKVTVSAIEEELPKPNYSIQTIDFIRSRFPNYKLSFCLGEDSLKSFHTWKSYSEILKYVDLLVAKRSDSVTIPNYLEAKVRVIEHSAIDISSTQVRQALLGGDSVTSLLDQATIDYIFEHKLYQKYEFK